MTQAPERIWAAHRQGKTTTILAGHASEKVEGWTEYVRADLCRASAAPADDTLRDRIARIITLDNLQLLHDFDVDGDLYRLDPECAAGAYATADAIIAALSEDRT